MANIIRIPDAYLPKADELPGDLQRIALGFEGEFPGKGVRITIALAQLFGGQNLYIRKADGFMRNWRDDSIRRRYSRGDVTVSELVSMFGLSARRLFEILGSAAELADDRQLPLFGEKQ